ncbi:MAG: hypothetical protein HWD61_04500 [Parachlamydiaceae bacterium]|nr:MAG: hypothetical protein HWD61_04500 [Parachlamydiaceae bacterium]
MTLTPILLFKNLKVNSLYDIKLREHLYGVSYSQAAQTIASNLTVSYDYKSVEETKIKVAIEGLTKLINDLKAYFPESDKSAVKPKELKSFDQANFANFLNNHEEIKTMAICHT